MTIVNSTLGNIQFRYRGTYSNVTSYIIDDVVDYNNTDYVCVTSSTGNAPTSYKTQKKTITVSGGVFYVNGVANPTITANRGDKLIFNLDSSTNNSQILQFATTSTSQTSNYYTTGVSYYLNDTQATQTQFINTTVFNAATKRRIEIEFSEDAPTTLYYFSNAGGSSYGNTITLANILYWKPVRYAFNFRGDHNNVSTSYKVGDVVKVTPLINNNNATGMSGTGINNFKETEAYYICSEDHTSNNTDTTLPQNRSTYLNKWTKLESEFEYDDTSFTVLGDIKTISFTASTDALRTVGYYMGVQGTWSGSGSPTEHALFDIRVIAGGSISICKINYAGKGYGVGDTITISDTNLGAGGAADFVITVTSIGKYSKGQIGRFTGHHRDCISLANRGTTIGGQNRWTRKIGQHNGKNVVNWPCFIDGSGGIKSWGSGSTGQHGVYNDQKVATNMVFPFLDWYRSTDNSGAGVHSTPDAQMPKCIQLESGYQSGMALFNNGEVYHWGYGGHGQNGDADTSSRSYPVRCGGSYSDVYSGSNVANHTLLNTKIVKIWLSNKHDNDDSTHSCYALDDTGGLWSWGYNGYGQLGHGDTSNRSRPALISKSSYFNNNNIVAFWVTGGSYTFCHALDDQNRLYSWGYNGYGQLGHGDTSQRNSPVEITSPAFTDAGVGKIAKLVKDDYGSYGRTAILTDKGRIYGCGYNGYGWMGHGDTSQRNSFEQIGSGAGSTANPSATQLWFTGNGQYHSMFTESLSGDYFAYGHNNNYQLGDGSSTDRSSAVTPYYMIRGSAYVFKDVKEINGHSSGDYHRTYMITNSGWLFVTGRNNYGCSSMGWSSSYVNDRSSGNGIEESTSSYFQLPRLLPDAVANIEEVQGYGYGTSDVYFCMEIRTKDNRYMRGGYGGSQQSGHHNGMSETIIQPPHIG